MFLSVNKLYLYLIDLIRYEVYYAGQLFLLTICLIVVGDIARGRTPGYVQGFNVSENYVNISFSI